jgi:hypothetical protein
MEQLRSNVLDSSSSDVSKSNHNNLGTISLIISILALAGLGIYGVGLMVKKLKSMDKTR